MRWVKQYKKKDSSARSIMKKLDRRSKIASMLPEKEEVIEFSIPPEKHFILPNGSRITDLHELAMCLESIDQSVFMHHVNSEKNDFANWVRDVFREESLAEAIAKAKDREALHVAVLKHLAFRKR